jgi:TRAP-type C4-dicarboxylate transport system permease small subunit
LEIVLFTIVGVALYFAADWALRTLERMHGAPLPYRNIVYFVIILVLALASFTLLQNIGPQ